MPINKEATWYVRQTAAGTRRELLGGGMVPAWFWESVALGMQLSPLRLSLS